MRDFLKKTFKIEFKLISYKKTKFVLTRSLRIGHNMLEVCVINFLVAHHSHF